MRTKPRLVLLLLPFSLFMALFFFSAILKSLWTSLGYYPLIGLHRLSLTYYTAALQDTAFLRTFMRTFTLAFSSTFLACLIGLGLAFLFSQQHNRWTRLMFKLSQLPVMLPHIFVVLALLQLLSQTGLIPRLLQRLGLIDQSAQFPLLVNDPGQIGILLTYLWKEVPFVIVTVTLVLRQIDLRYQKVALNLGANRWQTFWHILLPLVQPALFNAFIIIFSFTFGSYEVPYLLGNQQAELLPVYIYNLYVQHDLTQIPLLMSLNLLLSVFTIAFAGLLLQVSRWLPGGRTGGLR
ncbi:ABC transporter permease [Loigolactobacillus jiayinensis]|uniref:ABC transporter permease n=1 Tax=Loigolactobacillus jiayinensis TaxID=2486016 RepID=A0ABW1RD26_9LACO|nr:ABC transporter permease subunit [Loigolactobacillus jiayinensis]